LVRTHFNRTLLPLLQKIQSSQGFKARTDWFLLFAAVPLGVVWGWRYQLVLYDTYPLQHINGRASVSDPMFAFVFGLLAIFCAVSKRPFFLLAATSVLASLPNELRYFKEFSLLVACGLNIRLLIRREVRFANLPFASAALVVMYGFWGILSPVVNWSTNGWHVGIKTALIGTFQQGIWLITYLNVLGARKQRAIRRDLRRGIICAAMVSLTSWLICVSAFYLKPVPLNVSSYLNTFYFNRLTGFSGSGPFWHANAVVITLLALFCYGRQIPRYLGIRWAKSRGLFGRINKNGCASVLVGIGLLLLIANGSRSLWLLAVIGLGAWGIYKKSRVYVLLGIFLGTSLCAFGVPRGLPVTGHQMIWEGEEVKLPGMLKGHAIFEDLHRSRSVVSAITRDSAFLPQVVRERCAVDISGQPSYKSWTYLFIGVGLGNRNVLGDVHNEILCLLVETGVVGVLLYFCMVLSLIRFFYKSNTLRADRIFVFTGLLCLVVLSMFHELRLCVHWNLLLMFLATQGGNEYLREKGHIRLKERISRSLGWVTESRRKSTDGFR